MTDQNPLNLLREKITVLLEKKGLARPDFVVEYPREMAHGDVATNVALLIAKELQCSPREAAEQLITELTADAVFTRFEIAGPGFINAWLSDEWMELSVVAATKADFGHTADQKDQQILLEFTDPNPFKEFHIGHLMSNAVGEAMARLQEWSGATVIRLCYQGDVGMHIAKALYGLQALAKTTGDTLPEIANWELTRRVQFLGRAYAFGAQAYESDAKPEIDQINKAIYERSDDELNDWYDQGRAWSLEYFDTIYARLGTKFDRHYFERETGPVGRELVQDHLGDGIFTQSEGAIIFAGEKYGLHNRVFINSQGLPTYEAKELGLAQTKAQDYPDMAASVVVTGNEITEYFAVLKCALKQINPAVAAKTWHRPHGMLRLTSGKMSSRTGDVITAVSLLDELKAAALQRQEQADAAVADQIGIAAIKYAILKNNVGSDVIYDPNASLAFEGNTGPYLQYTHARAVSVLSKGSGDQNTKNEVGAAEQTLRRLLYRFPQVVATAAADYAPNQVCNYLFTIAQRYNELYAQEKIVGGEREAALLTLTKAVKTVLANGLNVLGIAAPNRL